MSEDVKALVERIEALLPKVSPSPWTDAPDEGGLGEIEAPFHHQGVTGATVAIAYDVGQRDREYFLAVQPANIRLLLSTIAGKDAIIAEIKEKHGATIVRANELSARVEQAEEGEREMLAALRAYEAFHFRLFCSGRPLEQDGKPIDHSDLNAAHALARTAITKGGKDGR